MPSLYDKAQKKKKQTTKAPKKQVQQVKKYVERDYKKNYYSSGNMVKDRMNNQQHFNSQPENPKYKAQNALLNDSSRYLTGGRAHWKIGYDVKDANGNKTGEYKRDKKQERKYYDAKFIKNAGTHNMQHTSQESGKTRKGVALLSASDMKEYKRNLNKSWGKDAYDLSPIHKVEPNGKQTAPIKEGIKQAKKAKTLLGKAGAIGGGLAGGAFNGVMEVVDALNSLNYGAHGYASGFVEGFNNDGKLNHGEILNALTNAGKKGSKGLKAGLTRDNEGRYGFYDTFKAFSDDKKEDRIRNGEVFTDADEKKRLAKLQAMGVVADIGGALLTANAGSLGAKGAQLVAKGNKIGGTALKGLSNVAKVTDLGIDLPIADLLRGTGKKLNGLKPIATNFDEVAPKIASKLDDMGKVSNTPENFKHMVDTVVRDVNKQRGVRNVSHGIKIGGFEVMSPKTVQSMSESHLNVPGRALNSVIDKIQASRRAKGYAGHTMDNMINDNVKKAINSDKLHFAPGNLAEGEVATDMQLLARKNNGTSEKIQRSNWANNQILKRKMGVQPKHSIVDEENLLKAELNNTPYESIRREHSMDNQFDRQLATDISPHIAPIVEDKPALQNVISRLRNPNKPMRMTEQGSDNFYDYLEKNNPNIYNKLTSESNEIDDVIESTTHRKPLISDNYTKTNPIEKVLKESEIPVKQPSNTKTIKHNDKAPVFKRKLTELFNQKADKNLILEQKANIEKITKPLAKNKLSNKERVKVVNELNNMFFDGQDVLSYNASKNDLNTLRELLYDGLDNSFNNVPDVLNKPLDELQKYMQSLTDINYGAKLQQRTKQFKGMTKTSIDNKIKELRKIKQPTVAQREEIRKLEKTQTEMQDWWKKHRAMTPDEWEKTYPSTNPELKGYNEALEESAITASRDKLKYDDVVIAPKGTDEYKRQLQEWNEYKHEDIGNKEIKQKLEQRRNSEARYDDDIRKDYSQSPRAEQEMLNDVGEMTIKEGKDRVKAIRKQFNLPETKPIKAKIKLTKGQKLGDLPPVKENLRHLRSAVEQEVQLRHINPEQHKHVKDGFKQIKMDYVKTLRNLGVRDEQYFHKVQALVKELEDAQSKPLMKMDITHLSRKIANTFDEIEDSVLDYTDEITPLSEITPLDKLVRGDKPIKDELQALIGRAPENGSESVKSIDEMINELPRHLEVKYRNADFVFDPDMEDNLIKDWKKHRIPSNSSVDIPEDVPNAFERYLEKDVEKHNNSKSDKDFELSKETEKVLKRNKPNKKQVDDTLAKLEQRLKDAKVNRETPLDNLVDEDGVIQKQNKYRRPKGYNKNLQKQIDNVDKYADEYVPDGDIKTLTPGAKKDVEHIFSDETKDALRRGGNLRGNKYIPDDITNKDVSYLKEKPEYSTTHVNEDGEIIANITGKPRTYEDEVAITKEQKLIDEISKEQNDSTRRFSAFNENEKDVRNTLLSMNPSKNTLPNKSNKEFNPLDMILKPYDALTREFKAGVTKNNPGWHGMNAIQNKMNSSYGIGSDVFNRTDNKYGKMVVDNMKGQREWLGMKVGKTPKTDEELSKIMINDKYSLKDIKDIAEQEGLVDDNFFSDMNGNKNKILDVLLPSGDKSMWSGFGLDKLARTEENDKMHHLISKLKQTGNSADAVDSVNRTLFDYDAITKGEKEIAKRIMPFYTYYRKNIPLQMEQFANSPRAMATYMDAKNQFEKGIEDEDKQRRNEWTANRLQVPNTTMEEKGRPDTMYNMMYNPSTPWDSLMQPPTPNAEGINNMPNYNPLLEAIGRYYGAGEDMFGNSYKDNNKDILDVLYDQYVKPTSGVIGKTQDIKNANSKQNAELEMLKLLTGVKAKYYKSNDEWNFDDKEDKKPYKSTKKELVKKYKR
ncbi:hypothetical protein [Romboutsia sp.]|uniref:hypothetical protein n=1 Tax=Romboutsia sp. TaxID=1965302 RepID=UPI002C0F2391|nr:hypothetical protein [Romboutsia sp.]HSQ90162.1 hypothetical protein [Romboutsia sp.]